MTEFQEDNLLLSELVSRLRRDLNDDTPLHKDLTYQQDPLQAVMVVYNKRNGKSTTVGLFAWNEFKKALNDLKL